MICTKENGGGGGGARAGRQAPSIRGNPAKKFAIGALNRRGR